MSDTIMNPLTKRFVKINSQKHKRLVVDGILKPETLITTEKLPEKVETEPEFDESKLQTKLADLSTDLIKDNLKKVVKAQKLSDAEMDSLLKRMLYKKLCMEEPKTKKSKEKPAKKKKKSKFKVVSSESESESSDSD